jgi:hypothetical protein
MNDSAFKALVSLLEDDDLEVSRHIEARFMEMGIEVIPRLRIEQLQHQDDKILHRIETIIYRLQAAEITTTLLNTLQKDDLTLLQAWFWVSKLQYPTLDYDLIRREITRLASRTWLEIKSGMNPVEKLTVINRMLFKKELFRPTRKGASEPTCYFLNNLLEQRRGAPLSLAMLYAAICHELDVPAEVISLPGNYAVVHYHDGRNEVFIDVFNKGIFFGKGDLRRFLAENEIDDDPRYYQPTPILNLIYNLVEVLVELYEDDDNLTSAKLYRELLQQLPR